MGKYKNARPKAGETEYGGTMGRSTTGVPEKRPRSALSASDELRLARLTDPQDSGRRLNYRVWYGETPKKSAAQKEGDLRS